MKKLNDNLSEIFDVEPMEQPEVLPAVKPTTELVANDEVEADAALARKNIKGLLDKGGAAIDNLLLVAQESEHPRAYEVAANFIKTLGDLNKRVQANDKVTGVYSNSTFTISTVDTSPTKAVAIVVTPNPPNANGNGPYGFEETFTEWPDSLV